MPAAGEHFKCQLLQTDRRKRLPAVRACGDRAFFVMQSRHVSEWNDGKSSLMPFGYAGERSVKIPVQTGIFLLQIEQFHFEITLAAA